ncbi:restriction endonuclease [Tolypothrix tenuis PCC 7101]|uniref:Restriction endonuclease n=1 Tax=Tolypothrix tenuis PCC 7101 TaxID=231146 RepID=A0A1Z4N3A7_9CYAN|nr:Bpu10I family restriction endonuclease [Aulosira sp. FACHB-113]BAZ00207.1 restriction endonuclease [Tolypothrix tenuis PCC 7101]BAZ75872.1 restriction endonuclease [Aulosira laxa NIES-50]
MLVHGANLSTKENHRSKYKDSVSKEYLAEIRSKYDNWHKQNIDLVGPGVIEAGTDIETIQKRVAFFEDYKNFIDQQHYAEKFDSRSNLHSSALEEFLYYLFKDLVSDFGERALMGKSRTFKDIFFAAPSYTKMLETPYARIEKKDHDFVIGVTVLASLQTSKSGLSNIQNYDLNLEKQTEVVDDAAAKAADILKELEQNIDKPIEGPLVVPAESLSAFSTTLTAGNSEEHFFDIPVIAIECKTYLDKTMLEGSSRAAEEVKARNPNGLYIVVMEWLKLSDAVNLRKYKVDQIYVLRKQKNTDREYRYLDSYVKNPIDPNVVWHLFDTVRKHLTTDWAGSVEQGLQRGWLI